MKSNLLWRLIPITIWGVAIAMAVAGSPLFLFGLAFVVGIQMMLNGR